MNRIQFVCSTVLLAATAAISNAALVQSVTGPVTGSGGGAGNTIIDTTNDTGDWINTFNASSSITYFIGWDWTVQNNAGESGAGGFFGGLSLYNTNGVQVFLAGNHWFETTFTAGPDSGYGNTAIAYPVGTATRLVLEITKVDAFSANWKFWVNPGSGSFATPNINGSGVSVSGLSSLRSRGGNSSGQAAVANLTVGTAFADAVPEPSAAALVAAGFAILGRRRGHRA